MKIISNSVEETIGLGAKLAKRLRRGSVVALVGELGSGKTVLTKGLAKGLGVKDVRYVNSPTFVIIKEYKGKLPLYHFDLYRLNRSSAIDAGIFQEYFYGDGVTVIEWADRIGGLLPKRHIEVKLAVLGEMSREIEISQAHA